MEKSGLHADARCHEMYRTWGVERSPGAGIEVSDYRVECVVTHWDLRVIDQGRRNGVVGANGSWMHMAIKYNRITR